LLRTRTETQTAKITTTAICLAALLCSKTFAVTIDTVPIGVPNNPADNRYVDGGIGSVPCSFRIAKTEISNAQYVEFLNAVADADPYGLYHSSLGSSTVGGIVRSGDPGSYAYAVKPAAVGQGPNGTDYSYENKPVVFISWYRAVRFANWLHNGQGNGDTESGAYTLLGPYFFDGETAVPSNANTIQRNPGARWFLPDQDEWAKAAYYDPGSQLYFDYPTASDSTPANNLPPTDTGNSANYSLATGSSSYPLTDVGAYSLSGSPFGTLDQGGNVSEWSETSPLNNSFGGIRGGAWIESEFALHASAFADDERTIEEPHIGFRVATVVPEPGTIFLLAIAFLLAGWRLGRVVH
jgi:formylglycine-generating enzyme required for sulfatase activity